MKIITLFEEFLLGYNVRSLTIIFEKSISIYDNINKIKAVLVGKPTVKENIYLDIPKFNQPKSTPDLLVELLHEITLTKDNAVDVDGDLTGGNFKVGDIKYAYSIKNIPNPYKDLGSFYNIQFTPGEDVQSTPQGGKENYIKILSTMYKIIVDFIEKEKPEYVGISSLDNDGGKNYHKVYANLTDNKFNRIPGYFRKDVSLSFDSPQGKGRFIVLKKSQPQEIDLDENVTEYNDVNPSLPKVYIVNKSKTNAKIFGEAKEGHYLYRRSSNIQKNNKL